MRGDDGGNAARAVVSPLCANVYLHYVFGLWVEQWRKRQAKGDMIAVRYADELPSQSDWSGSWVSSIARRPSGS